MVVYIYDNNKKYIGTRQAQIDPLETKKQGKEIYIMPANSTTIKPLELKDGYEIIWNSSNWEYQEIPKPKKPEPYTPSQQELRKFQIQARLSELSQDFVQAQLGAEFSDLEERKTEFKTLHNELRMLLGKNPRNYVSQQTNVL